MTAPKTFWQTLLAFSFLATLSALIASALRWAEIGVILQRSLWGLVLLLYLGSLAVYVWLFFGMKKEAGSPRRFLLALEFSRLQGWGWRILAAGVFLGILWLLPWLKFSYHIGEVVKKSTQDPVLSLIIFYFGAWWLLLLASAACKVAGRISWPAAFTFTWLFFAIVYEIYQRSQAITAYPFSLGWSEGSRYFYASLFFAPSLYGQNLPLSTLHPSRYLLQSLPFLFPGLGLEAHRAWQAALWIFLSGLSAWALARKTQNKASPGLQILLGGWLFLFFLRVGLYYHLQPMLFLPLLFVSSQHPRRSLLIVALTSLWAGISRVNWFPLPAMLAASIELLEGAPALRQLSQPGQGAEQQPLWKPSLLRIGAYFALGLVSALLAQAAYILLSGNAQNAAAFGSSFSSALLWYRLWPNKLYPLGIVPGILLLTSPLLVGLGFLLQRLPLPLWRKAALWAMLALLFGGSLVVSVKIGGGGDLHNMDTYAALLAVLFVLALSQTGWPSLPWPLLTFALLLPLGLLLPTLSPPPTYDLKSARQSLAQLQAAVENAPGPVLFINERQLLTFGLVRAPLQPDYEAVTLMEMAMSGSQTYLQKFYRDLQTHRFSRIVAGKQNLGLKEEGAFAEENNTWNTRVAPYILCYYEPILTLEPGKSKVLVFAPRAEPGNCP